MKEKELLQEAIQLLKEYNRYGHSLSIEERTSRFIQEHEEKPKYVYSSFNLDKAANGHLVQTVDNRPVRIICSNAKRDHYPVVALVETPQGEYAFHYTLTGKLLKDKDSPEDLILVQQVK